MRKTFKKNINAATTGYVLKDYNENHECYGCPYIVTYKNWQTKEVEKRECRATPEISYQSYCNIAQEDKDFSMCYFYTLDLLFAKRVYNFVNTLEGQAGENSIPKEWRAADFDNCHGLIKFPLNFQKNKKGAVARKDVYERYFDFMGKRNRFSESWEQGIILQRIQIAKANAQAESNNITFAPVEQKCREENKMTAEFNLGAMLSSPALQENQVRQIPVDMLIPYHNHKFELYTGERLDDMVESINENGVLIPIIVQPTNSGNADYEILIGHNRWNGSKLAGKETVPAIIKEGLTAEEAEMYVIESNLMQRGFDNLKISEQAAVIAMRYEKMFCQGKRNDIVSELKKIENTNAYADEQEHEDNKAKNSRELVGDEYGLSRNSIARLLRVDKLIEELKPLVDDKTISIRAAVNISYLNQEAQEKLIKFSKQYKIDIKKSEQLREYATSWGELGQAVMLKILMGVIDEKPAIPKPKTIKLQQDIYSKFFEEDVKADEVANTIEKALELYFNL